ncbi:MAG TPA: cobyrinate a,c-diamide synthase, partial [Asanoa sp.]|nr:cobyrinate a,c-diamide synthase [Asanoa sp.]
MSAVPRVVVSAPSSGHGKTALAVGLLAAFAGRGLSAVGFKVGPDHTDAAYLGAAAGSHGRNLDPRLIGAHRVAPLFAHGAEGHDIAVVEGTMGLFDSLAGRVETDSTAGVAAALRAPVIMVVDVGAMGQSVAALVHGFRAYDELTWLGGVILNRVASDRHEQLLREALDDIGVPVYGALRRRDLPSALPPRQEGVVPVVHREVEALRGIRRLGESITGAVDLDGLLALANSAPQLPVTPWSPASELALHPDDTAAVHLGRRPIVALAGGPGLSFSYAETRELLEAAGATVVTFDPLRDELLPESTDALVIGGALPEAFAEDLSANRRLCADIADLARSGRPVIAEGAGLLWLAQSFDGRPMCGVLDATGATGDQMIVGYRDATARATTAVAEVGTRVVGYKQHRGVVSPRAGQTPAWTWNGGTPEGFVWRRVHASQLSLHWAGFPEIARRLILAARPGEAAGPGSGGSWARPTGTVPVLSAAPSRPTAPSSGGGAWPGATDSGEGTWPGATEPVPVVGVPAIPGGPRPVTPPSGPGAPTSGDGARPEAPAPDGAGRSGSQASAHDGQQGADASAGSIWSAAAAPRRDARAEAAAPDDSAWSAAPGPAGGDVRPMPASGVGALDYGTGLRPADGFAPENDDPTDGRGFSAPGPPQLRSVPVPADGDHGDSGGPPVSAPRLRAVPGSGGLEPADAGTDGHGFARPGPPRLRV